MATYTFLNKRTKKIEEHVMSMSEYDKFKAKNKHLERYHDEAPSFNYTKSGEMRGKTDDTWKEVLSKIAEQNPRSNLASEYGKKNIKQVKTEQIFDKHIKKQKKQKP